MLFTRTVVQDFVSKSCYRYRDEEAVYITEPGTALMNPESLVSIRKDLDNGVATISVREGSGQVSLEVEGGRDGELTHAVRLEALEPNFDVPANRFIF